MILVEEDIENQSQMYLFTQLHQWNSFFKRCWIALKYIFNRAQPLGHWDSTMIGLHDAEELHAMLDTYINNKRVETLVQ